MRIIASYRGTEKVWVATPGTEVIIGRTREKTAGVFDLSPDQKVSRVHGRIWEEAGSYWIEDLNSTRGVRLNGEPLAVGQKHPVRPGDVIEMGETILRVDPGASRESDAAPAADGLKQTNYLENGTVLVSEPQEREAMVAIDANVSAGSLDAVDVKGVGEDAARRLKIVWDLPLQFAS
ncbi:MAG: FHA domain-containing protein, partial [Terriglobales bacterium]